MRTFISNKFLIVFFMLLSIKYCKAQIPANDSAWVKNSGLSDEFNSATLDASKWDRTDDWAADGASVNYNHNAIMTGSSLKLRADTLIPFTIHFNNYCQTNKVYVYQGARIWSKTPSYKYGYLEIAAKFPHGRYFPWTAFWLYNSKDTCQQIPAFYNEIDITENGGQDSYDWNSGTNIHVNIGTPPPCGGSFTTTDDGVSIIDTPGDTTAFHKYAVQWDTTKVVYRIDDVPVRTIINTSSTPVPTYSMFALLEIKIDPWHTILPAGWNPCYTSYTNGPTGFPGPMDLNIDYMRYYKLIAGNSGCTTAATNLCSLSSYYRKVYKSITTDKTCSPNINPSTWNSSYTLRATDYVLLDVPSGSNSLTINPSGTGYFAIDIVPCPQ